MASLGRRPGAAPLTSADIPDNSITGAKIVDDAIDSEHYVAGSVDAAHVAADVATQVELDAQRTNSSITTLGTVTAGVLNSGVTGGSGLTAVPSPFTLSAVNSSTGVTSKAFESIPSWHRHIYLFINGVSFSGSGDLQMRIGYGSTTYQASGYISMQTNAIASQSTSDSEFKIVVSSSGRSCYGMSIFTRMNDTTYYWQNFMSGHSNVPTYAAGQVILSSGPATAVLIQPSGGDTQDAGTVYAGWE